MAIFPIYGYFKGDLCPLLVPIDTDDSMNDVAGKIAYHSLGKRIPDKSSTNGYLIKVHDKQVRNNAKFSEVLEETGLKPLEWVTVEWDGN